MTEPSYNKHLLSLTAIFILGDAVIILPYKAGEYSVLGYLLAVSVSLLLFLVAIPLARLLTGNENSIFLKCVSVIIAVLLAVYSLYNAGLCFKRYIGFADKILLPNTQKIFMVILFVAVTAFLAGRSKEVILKLSLVFIVIAALAIMLFFLLSFKDFRLDNIKIYSLPSFKELIKAAKPYFLTVSLPAVLIPFYTFIFANKRKIIAPFWGLSLGLILLAFCVLDSLLLFGTSLAARLSYPLSAAVSTVTVGPLFTRMDGVVYCLIFLTSLIKTTLCMKLSFLSIKKIKEVF